MNEMLQNTNIFNKIILYLKNNFKVIVGLSLLIIVSLLLFQLFVYIQSQKILKKSILFDDLFSNQSNLEINSSIERLSKDKSFYGVLSTLEVIKIKLNNNEVDAAYVDYLFLLNKNQLNNLYKSAIAVHGAYSLLDKINIVEGRKDLLKSSVIYGNIINLISFIDENHESFKGYKLEISFLLLIADYNISGDKVISDETNELYKKIQESDKISSSLKERVRKVYESQIYK